MQEYIEKKWVTGRIETRNILNEHRDLEVPTVNWSAAGAQSVDQARDFARRVLDVCDEIEKAIKGQS